MRAESWAARDVIADDVIAGNVTSDDPVLPVRRRKSRRHHADDVTVTMTTASERQAHSDSEQQQQQQQHYESVLSTSLGHLPDVTSLHDGGVTSAGVTALYAEPHDMARRGRRHSTSATSSTAPAAAAAAAAAGASEAETARPTVSVTRRRRQAGGGEVETAASWSVSDGYESVDYSDDDTQQQSRSKQQVLD